MKRKTSEPKVSKWIPLLRISGIRYCQDEKGGSMTNIKYDGFVEEIRTETKLLDELLKTDMETYKRQYWYGYVNALKDVLERLTGKRGF